MSEIPDVAQVLGQLLSRVPREQQPLLVALAERQAAQRYRAWAEAYPEPARRELQACAAREEDIAARVEALYPDASAVQADIRAKVGDLDEVARGLFADRPVLQQLDIQTRGERLGAATWRAFAQGDDDPKRADTFLACAQLEEQSARVLDGLLAEGRAPGTST